jgi:hypothetical protein
MLFSTKHEVFFMPYLSFFLKRRNLLEKKNVRLTHLQSFDKGNRTDCPFCNFNFRMKDSPLQLQVDQRNFAAWIALYLVAVDETRQNNFFKKKLKKPSRLFLYCRKQETVSSSNESPSYMRPKAAKSCLLVTYPSFHGHDAPN